MENHEHHGNGQNAGKEHPIPAPKPKPVNTSAASKQDTQGITAKKEADIGEWYSQVVLKAEVADYAPIRGFMAIRPRGYYIWQCIMNEFNSAIEKEDVGNSSFPSLIPESFFRKEAEHAEGFSPEVAWVERRSDLEERFAIRPTSETIITDYFSRWVRSWRDLPMKVNQWCNIVRWEVQDTKIFLRSREFLWQEGHCLYVSEKECHKDTMRFLEIYREITEDLCALPVLVGRKTDKERFAGAIRTYAVEVVLPDGKALQLCTSHDLGQGFAKAFNVKFVSSEEKSETPWQNSWGMGTRHLGALIMTHSDNKGLVLPPRLAKNKIVVVPILFDATKETTLARAKEITKSLKRYGAMLDDREGYSAGWKFNEHELAGVPLRVEIGPKDIEKNQVVVVRRDTGEKSFIAIPDLQNEIRRLLDAIHSNLFERARARQQEQIVMVSDWSQFEAAVNGKKFALAPHCGKEECEGEIKEVTKGVTTRCIPLKGDKLSAEARCIRCEEKAKYNVYFARAY